MNTLAQRLQDYFEQHHGLCLPASEWDSAAATIEAGIAENIPSDTVLEEIRSQNSLAIETAKKRGYKTHPRLSGTKEVLEQVQFLCCNHGGDLENDPAKVLTEIHSLVTSALNEKTNGNNV